jgi:hypothetical protein
LYLPAGATSINMDARRVVLGKQFLNKLWNATRFVVRFLPPLQSEEEEGEEEEEEGGGFGGVTGVSADDVLHARLRRRLAVEAAAAGVGYGETLPLKERWILSRLAETIETVDRAMSLHHTGGEQGGDGGGGGGGGEQGGGGGAAAFSLATATSAVQRFVLDELCDVYLEAAKPVLWAAASGDAGEAGWTMELEVLGLCLDCALRLLHPVAPFATEELWQHTRRAMRATEGWRRSSDGEVGSSDGHTSISAASFPRPCAYRRWHDGEAEGDMALVLGAVRGARAQIKAAREILGVERRDDEPEEGAAAGAAGAAGAEWSLVLRCADERTAGVMRQQAALVGARSGRSVEVEVALDGDGDSAEHQGGGGGAEAAAGGLAELSSAVGKQLRGARRRWRARRAPTRPAALCVAA